MEELRMELRLLDATEPLLVLLSASPLKRESVRLRASEASDLLLESEVKSVVISAVAFSQGASSSTTGIRPLPATDLRTAVAEDFLRMLFSSADVRCRRAVIIISWVYGNNICAAAISLR